MQLQARKKARRRAFVSLLLTVLFALLAIVTYQAAIIPSVSISLLIVGIVLAIGCLAMLGFAIAYARYGWFKHI